MDLNNTEVINSNHNFSLLISTRCTNCGICKLNCPVKAIQKIEKKLIIDNECCTRCNKCKNACPIKAIDTI